MKLVSSTTRLQQLTGEFRLRGESVGFVPTMGFLHQGHLALVRRARRENRRLIVSIFVNPLQFGPQEDYAAYPRSARRDRALLRQEGVDALFEPTPVAFYPAGYATRVTVTGPDQLLCGAYRPGHFTGVATVVCKLLHAAHPDRLYLGAKDYQQSVVVRRMILDLNLPVRVVLCPTVREKDGLALSSRNVYLSPEERAWAPRLYRALREAAAAVAEGRVRRRDAAVRLVERRLAGGPGTLQYADILGAADLAPVDPLRGDLVLALAYLLGRARLIDNVRVRAPGPRAGAAARPRRRPARGAGPSGGNGKGA